jgi:hypothetical protein
MDSKTTPFDTHGNTIHQSHATIAELYPGIGRLILFVAFEEADSESEPNYQQIIFTPGTEAAFQLDCSRDGCKGGGYNFSPIIDDMVKKLESRVHGTLACGGTLGPEGCCCSLKAEYRIIAD